MSHIILPVIFDNYTNRADNTVKLSFSTQELTTDKIVQLHELRNSFGAILFKAGEKLVKDEIKLLDSIDMDLNNGKTQSQRLRSVLWLNWQKKGSVGDFKEFYKTETERIIEHYKSKLEL
jgi:hypothetical protein